MSLKGGISSTELLDTIEAMQKGDDDAKRRVDELARKGIVSSKVYNNAVNKYDENRRANIEKEKKNRKKSRKIKGILCSIVALLVLFDSMASRLVGIVGHDGKGAAAFYLILWFWAFSYALSTDSEKISDLERENEWLKKRMEIYESQENQR